MHRFQEGSAVYIDTACATRATQNVTFTKWENVFRRLRENMSLRVYSETVEQAGLVINQFENVENNMWAV